MSHILATRIGASSTTTGAGDLTLGAALTAHRAFSAALVTGDTTEYLIAAVDADGIDAGAWEVGVGTYYGSDDGGGERLERTMPAENSAGTPGAFAFAAGAKRVVLSPLAERIAAIPPGGQHGQTLEFDSGSYGLKWVGAPTPALKNAPGWNLYLYVRTDGNDDNTGLEDNPGGAFRRIDRAIMEALQYDLDANDVTIQVGNGTYAEIDPETSITDGINVPYDPDDLLGADRLKGRLNIVGNMDNQELVVATQFSMNLEFLQVTAKGIRFMWRCSAGNAFLYKCDLGNPDDPDAATATWLSASRDTALAECRLRGDADVFVLLDDKTSLGLYDCEFTESANAATCVLQSTNGGEIEVSNAIGSVTGKQFIADRFSIINTFGDGAESLPGSVPGDLNSGSVLI